MNELFKILLSLSLSGTLLILALFLCKPFYKNKLSRQWQYYIWLVAVARLLLPFTPETSLVGNLFRGFDSNIIQISTSEQTNSPFLSETDFAEHETPSKNQVEKITQQPSERSNTLVQRILEGVTQNRGFLFSLVWLISAIGFLIRKVTIYQSFVKYVKVGCTEVTDIRIWEQLGKLVEQAGVKRNVEIYINNLISSPLLIGFFHPCIILPSAKLSNSDLKNTILHELTHYKRGDMFYKWLVQGTICLHWFNPFVYIMGREINKACEFSCDETIIKNFDKQGQKAYGDTLLNALNQNSTYKDSLVCVTLNKNTKILKERLDAIMGFKKKTKIGMAISIALVFVISFGATAAGAYTIPFFQGKAADKAESPISSLSLPKIDGLSLVKKEYSITEIKSLSIEGVVVEALLEDISITRGGTTLKVQYYVQNPNDYTLQIESDGGGTFKELVLQRAAALNTSDIKRPISITIPENINFKLISAVTTSGNINLKNYSGENIIFETKSGDISISGVSASNLFKVNTKSGNAIISNFSTDKSKFGTNFETESGTITFRPKDTIQNYCFIIDTGTKAKVVINGKKYSGKDYSINTSGIKGVHFDSTRGSLIVQGKENKNGTLLEAEKDINNAEYDMKYDAGNISNDMYKEVQNTKDTLHKEVREAVRKEIREDVRESIQDIKDAARKEARESIQKDIQDTKEAVRKEVLNEARKIHLRIHPGVSFENCPICHSSN